MISVLRRSGKTLLLTLVQVIRYLNRPGSSVVKVWVAPLASVIWNVRALRLMRSGQE
jgi:hypothetical protein